MKSLRGILSIRNSITVRLCSTSALSGKSFDPEQIVEALDKHIIGQKDAKRAVAIAFRNRYRRRQLKDDIQKEITPANILMKGPTGCGKTEIARRISSLAQAPFVKVEATRYTEVGIVGANTNSMVKDLLDIAITQEKERAALYYQERAKVETEKTILAGLNKECTEETLKQLRDGEYDDELISIPLEVLTANKRSSSKFNGSGSDSDFLDGNELISNIFNNFSSNGSNAKVFISGSSSTRKNSSKANDKKVTVKEAYKAYVQYYTDLNIDETNIINEAKKKTEQEGIIFIDEIDKLASGNDDGGGYARGHSLKEGVQKELLTLLEGTSVMTKYGPISTSHILFIASGAFHTSAISDLLPELQGRLPVRVELKSLDMNDLKRILSEKKYNLIQEVTALMNVEKVTMQFTEDGISEIARYAYLLNSTKGNIGARRLTSVMHTIMEDISYIAHRLGNTTQIIDKTFVASKMKKFDPTSEDNLSRYIL